MKEINKRDILKQSIYQEVCDGWQRDHSVDKEVQYIILEIINSKEDFIELAKDNLSFIDKTIKNYFEGFYSREHKDCVWVLFKFYFLNNTKVCDAKFNYSSILDKLSKEIARIIDTYYKLTKDYKITEKDELTLKEELKEEIDFETRETISKFTKKEQYKPHLNFTKVHRNRLLEEYKDSIEKLNNVHISINNLKPNDKYWGKQLFDELNYINIDVYLAELELTRRLKFYDDMLVLIGNSDSPDKSVTIKITKARDTFPWKKEVLYAKEVK